MRTDDGKPPDDLAAAPAAEPGTPAAFRRLPPGDRREYLEWIDEAKLSETRRRRIEKTIRMLHG